MASKRPLVVATNAPGARIKRLALASASGSALLLAVASSAMAQDTGVEQVVVSSTRITAAGFDAPTPTTVIDSAAIEKSAESNIFTTITEMPSLLGSTGTETGNNGTSGGTNGLSSLNLRSIGTNRTLVLLDSQRVVPANVTGVDDISEFPQLLIQRVDIVTGGASASYGSDAVAGVVNFITDKKFEGLKFNVSGGLSTYGDDANAKYQMAAGTSFLNGRGHIEASVEYAYEQGIPQGGAGNGPGPNGRTWYQAPNILQRTIAATPAGSPQYTYATNTQDYQLSKYGLITAGPLQGIAFGTGGQPYNFQYGSNGVPSLNSTGSVSNCVSPFCVGGDTSGNPGNGTTIVAPQTRGDFYTRISYDLTDKIEVYGTLNVAEVFTQNYPQIGARKEAALTIQCGNASGGANAFLPASINAACVSNKITNFQYGVSNDIFPQSESVHALRNQRRYVLGMNGAFNLFGKDWSFDTYFQHGENDTDIHINNITLTPRYNAAIDAIAGPNGTIVCRSASAQASGCVPLNIIGNNAPTETAMNYIEPPAGPRQQSYERQEAFSATVNGTPIADWAGDVAVATGFEYREEAYNVVGDPYSNGVTATNPVTAAYPADPLLDLVNGNNWFAGNFHSGGGNYHVSEGFVELGIPILNDIDFGKMDLDIAGRATGYSTSGYVQTWKVGGTWQTPLDGLKLRGVQSRDVRAPNLSELFTAVNVGHGSVTNYQGVSQGVQEATLGNTALKPEKSQTTEVGVVFQPSWFPGFSSSVDYFRVAIKGQIGGISAQQEVNICQASGFVAPVCGAINFNAQPIGYVNAQVFNLSSTVTDGFDFEAGYNFDLQSWDVPGSFNLRALATHTSKFITDPGVPGSVIAHTAGANTGNVPLWKTYTTQSWDYDRFGFTLTERWFSDGVFNKTYITCTTGCPVPTLQNPTINYNKMQGAFYLDVGGTFNVTDNGQLYFKIDNITNFAPVPSPGTASNNNGLNEELYDKIGRMFRVGMRFTTQ